MEAIIKKNSTQLLIVDPREYGDYNVDWDDVLNRGVVTFSLFDVETGCYTVASRAGEIIPGGLSANDEALTNSVACGDNTSVTRIAYRFRSRDTKRSGVYRGTFQVNVLGEETILAVPATGDIQIVVTESSVNPWSQSTYTGMAEIVDTPSTGVTPTTGTGPSLIPHTWAELNTLLGNNQLVPGQEYLLTDYQTIHRVPTVATVNTGSVEPLIIQALTTASFSRVAKSQLNPNDSILYDFLNEFVKCEDSFDGDILGAGQSCENNDTVHRPGYIAYRCDTVKQLSAYYDFRAYVNRVNNISGLTFGTAVTNAHLGQGSGNIMIPSGTGYVIGENSCGLYLTKIADRIKIGNDVRQFSTSGASIAPRVFAGSTFELGDGGTDGVIRSTINMAIDNLGFEGNNLIGFVPKGAMLSTLEIAGSSVPKVGLISMGINGISDAEVFGPMPMRDIATSVFSASVTTKAPAANTELTLKLQGVPSGQGRLQIKAAFIASGYGVNLFDRTPNDNQVPGTGGTNNGGDGNGGGGDTGGNQGIATNLLLDNAGKSLVFKPAPGTTLNDYEVYIEAVPEPVAPLINPPAPGYGAVEATSGRFAFTMLQGTSPSDYEIEYNLAGGSQ